MLANLTLRCSICGNTNAMPRVHANMMAKDETRTFCSSCGAVTPQTVVGGAPPPLAAAAAATPMRSGSPAHPKAPLPGSAAAAAAQLAVPGATSSGGSAGVAPAKTPLDDAALWAAAEARVRQHGLLMEDIARRDDATRGRFFASIGFTPGEEKRLVALARVRLAPGGTPPPAPGAAAPAAQPGAAPAFGALGTSANAGAPMSLGAGALGFATGVAAPGRGAVLGQPHSSGPPPLSPSATPYPALSQSAAGASPAGWAGESNVKGLTIGADGAMIARCSVYPHLPAEFWCVACGVLVSSRCHVQGIHKDHPFVPLRLAAESHVRDVSAWNERCRAQLNVIDAIGNNLRHGQEELGTTLDRQQRAVDDAVNLIVTELTRWRDQLKADIAMQVKSQLGGLEHAYQRTMQMRALYGGYLAVTEPLMSNIPPLDRDDRETEHWSLRVLDSVTRLKQVAADAIPIPKLVQPMVQCHVAPSTFMDLIRCTTVPLGVKLPDLIDPGYFNFPVPSSTAKHAFTLAVAPPEAAAKGLSVTQGGRTLSRTPDAVGGHCLVLGSQVLYGGTHSWEVHIDRMGSGAGRVLAGVVISGSDGEGIVWDGTRIVGPNEGECRILDDRFAWAPGTVLRFYVELEGVNDVGALPATGSGSFLTCFHNNEGVARIPLPPNANGWLPAFSVYGPQDQISIVPSVAASGGVQPASARMERRAAAAAAGDTVTMLERQENMISTLQQQLQNLSQKLEADTMRQLHPRGTDASFYYGSQPPQHSSPQHQQQPLAVPPTDSSMVTAGALQQPPPPQPPQPMLMQQQPVGAGAFASPAPRTPYAGLAVSPPPPPPQPFQGYMGQQQQQQQPQQPYGYPPATAVPPSVAAAAMPAGPPPTTVPASALGGAGADIYSPELRQIMNFMSKFQSPPNTAAATA